MFNFQWGPPGYGWGRHKRGRRFRRGILKYVFLKILAEGQRHGYDLMRLIQEKGWGTPGPGSVYPILNALEEEGLVTSKTEGDRRVYEITDKGRRHLEEHFSHGNFWENLFEPEGPEGQTPPQNADLQNAATRLMQAVSQVGSSKPETVDRVRDMLDRTRKEIYTLLAQE